MAIYFGVSPTGGLPFANAKLSLLVNKLKWITSWPLSLYSLNQWHFWPKGTNWSESSIPNHHGAVHSPTLNSHRIAVWWSSGHSWPLTRSTKSSQTEHSQALTLFGSGPIIQFIWTHQIVLLDNKSGKWTKWLFDGTGWEFLKHGLLNWSLCSGVLTGLQAVVRAIGRQRLLGHPPPPSLRGHRLSGTCM